MSNRVKTRVVLEIDEYEDSECFPKGCFDFSRSRRHGSTVTEISRERVKGEKTERQERFEKRLIHYQGLLSSGVCLDEAQAFEFCANALRAEIERMEGER